MTRSWPSWVSLELWAPCGPSFVCAVRLVQREPPLTRETGRGPVAAMAYRAPLDFDRGVKGEIDPGGATDELGRLIRASGRKPTTSSAKQGPDFFIAHERPRKEIYQPGV